MIRVIGNVLKALMFFLDLWRERDRVKIKVKAEIAQKMIGAFAETNPVNQASQLNVIVRSINSV